MNRFFLPFRGVFCRVSPIAFDGTLSFLELLNKLQYYVNDLANSLNSLETALEQFESYVETALDEKQDVLTWDEIPTADSTNPVYSRGIKRYVDIGLSGKQDALTWDEAPTANSNNPVYSKGIKTYVDNGLALKQDLLTWDSTPTTNSNNPVYSKGVKAYVDNGLAGKQDTLTFDLFPMVGSNNPVTSNGIAGSINAVQNRVPWGFPATLDYINSTFTVTGVTFADLYNRMHTYSQPVYAVVTITNTGETRADQTYFYVRSYSNAKIEFDAIEIFPGNALNYLRVSVDSSDTWTVSKRVLS